MLCVITSGTPPAGSLSNPGVVYVIDFDLLSSLLSFREYDCQKTTYLRWVV